MRRGLRSKGVTALMCAAALLALSESSAQSTEAPPPAEVKPGKTKSPKASAAKAAPTAIAAPPCARGRWKDDPVCFGADDPSALPTPSARGGDGARRGDLMLEPKGGVNLDPRAAQDPVSFTGNSPTPKPSNNDFGAGFGLKLPF